MKNLHVLATDKPSRLCFRNYYFINKDNIGTYSNVDFKNIYITSSDEESKKRDWFVSLNEDESFMEIIKNNEVDDFSEYADEDWVKNCKKIILTTDQDLINDGVQAIDDVFLEWFVENPSCEEIQVERIPTHPYSSSGKEFGAEEFLKANCTYKIIIPKEEPKQDYSGVHLRHCYQGEYKNGCKYGEDDCPAKRLEEPKDVVLGYKTSLDAQMLNKKWQAERMYSEEEVESIWKFALWAAEQHDKFGTKNKSHFIKKDVEGFINGINEIKNLKNKNNP